MTYLSIFLFVIIGLFGFLVLSFIIYTIDTVIENSGELKRFEKELHREEQEERRIYDIESILAEIERDEKLK